MKQTMNLAALGGYTQINYIANPNLEGVSSHVLSRKNTRTQPGPETSCCSGGAQSCSIPPPGG
jgi:hypothetical protein